MKHTKIGAIALLLFGMIIVLSGIVYADTGVNATPETQSLGTVTIADVVGLATESDAGAWTLTNDPIGDPAMTEFVGEEGDIGLQTFIAYINAVGGTVSLGPDDVMTVTVPDSALGQPWPGGGLTYQQAIALSFDEGEYSTSNFGGSLSGIHTGALHENQVQYTTAYDANIVAQGGKTSFIKQMTIDTRNKVTSQSNIKAQTGLTFAATDNGGNVVGSENLLIDGAGDLTYARERMLCPFVASNTSIIPAFCNIVQAGSKYDLTVGSVTTNADDRFVGTSANDPVVLNYAINIKPYGTTQGQIPSIGAASAYIKAHLQEARGWDENLPVGGMNKSEDLTYSETSSAQGTISTFSKEMGYSSQVTSLPSGGNHIIHASVENIGTFTVDGNSAYISPNGDIQVPDHSSITFTMGTLFDASNQFSLPSTGSAQVFVDGVDQGVRKTYTFQDVTSDHTIVASPIL
jgi:hypothetical protein